jgi:hypothetical protein
MLVSIGSRRRRRKQQRGSALVISVLVLTGLITLGGLTVLSVQGGVGAAGHERHKSSALYAAESGAAAAMDYLRRNIDTLANWSAFVSPANLAPHSPAGIVGNGVLPGEPGNLFAADVNAWYEVEILNNRDDPQFAAGSDDDGRVIIRATGERPCPGYGQKGMAEDGAGRNDCLGSITNTGVATYTPGGAP